MDTPPQPDPALADATDAEQVALIQATGNALDAADLDLPQPDTDWLPPTDADALPTEPA